MTQYLIPLQNIDFVKIHNRGIAFFVYMMRTDRHVTLPVFEGCYLFTITVD